MEISGSQILNGSIENEQDYNGFFLNEVNGSINNDNSYVENGYINSGGSSGVGGGGGGSGSTGFGNGAEYSFMNSSAHDLSGTDEHAALDLGDLAPPPSSSSAFRSKRFPTQSSSQSPPRAHANAHAHAPLTDQNRERVHPNIADQDVPGIVSDVIFKYNNNFARLSEATEELRRMKATYGTAASALFCALF